jgi:hypothetical protein
MVAAQKRRTLRENFWWATHNLIGHPLSEILYWCWLGRLGDWVHDVTVPAPYLTITGTDAN